MKTTPPQQYRDLEKLGYLCRWGLLALAATVLLATALAGLSGAMAISADLKADLLLSDAVWRQGSPMPSLRGYLDKTRSYNTTPLIMLQDHLGNLRFSRSYSSHNEIVSWLPKPPAGQHKLTLTGLPYGPMAFVRKETAMWIVPRGMTVYLVDVRFLVDVEKNDKQAAIRIARGFTNLGQIVLICPPDTDTLKRLSTELIRYNDIPRVFSLRKDKGDPMSVITTITNHLRNRSKARQEIAVKPYVVTGEVKLAVAAAGKKHFTHLVAPANAPSDLPEMIRLHTSADKLADHLADESPTHLPIP